MTSFDDESHDAEFIFLDWVKKNEIDDVSAFEELCRENPGSLKALTALRQEWRWLEGACDGEGPEMGAPVDFLSPSGERYNVLEKIGEGGMGVVYSVWDTRYERELAMKVCSAGERVPGKYRSRSATRFLDEARIIGRLEHPGVVPVHDLGVDPDGHIFFTMRRVKGHDFRTVLQMVHSHSEGWTRERALESLIRVCETLACAHSKGVIYRDLKPSNIMVGSYGQTYVIDWGLAKVRGRRDGKEALIRSGLTSALPRGGEEGTSRADLERESPPSLRTADGVIVGTPSYMAPEQATGDQGRVGARADIYAMGAILYHLLTGRAPYSGDSSVVAGDVLEQLRGDSPEPIEALSTGVSKELIAICKRAMARDLSNRYASMDLLAEDLRAFLEMRPVSAYRTDLVTGTRKWVRRNPMLAAGCAAAVTMIVSISFAYWSSNRERMVELNATRGELERTSIDLSDMRREGERKDDELQLASHRNDLLDYAGHLAAARELLAMFRSDEAKHHLDACPQELRGWEWRLLVADLDRSSGALHDPEGDPGSGHCSLLRLPGGEVVTGSGDGWIRVWDLEERKPLRRFRHGGDVCAMAITADGSHLFSGGHSGYLAKWDLETGQLSNKVHPHPGGFFGIINCLALHPSEDILASASSDNTIKLFDSRTLEELGTLAPASSSQYAVCFSPDGKILISQDADHHLRFWSCPDWELLDTVELLSPGNRTHHRTTCSFSPDGVSLSYS
jgi:serine/threonine protein kinase